ncbi:MAG TPA: hypothetical protein VFF75_06505 [Methylophilaceae bacterium]|nr:hypothetical protein [Methylophilaceae bacterium]
MRLSSFNPQRFTDSQLYLKEVDGSKLLIKAYLNKETFARRDMEIARNSRWASCGFKVPEILGMQCEEIADPHVVMRYLQGARLSEYLKDKEVDTPVKLKTLTSIFLKNYSRHDMALATQDELLLHTDPNTDNIILDGEEVWFIDFEHISKPQDLLTGIGKEVATFSRRVIQDMGIEHAEKVIYVLLQAYQFNTAMMDKLEELTLKRPFQFIHRLKNAMKKKANPELVTRYDVAETLRFLRRNQPQ